MSYMAARDRYDCGMEYRRCGRSGVKLMDRSFRPHRDERFIATHLVRDSDAPGPRGAFRPHRGERFIATH